MAHVGSNETARSANRNNKPHNPSNSHTMLEERFGRAERKLTANRKHLIQNILDDSEETYFLSSRELATRYGVDIGTVVRTIQVMGYKRYADFASDLRSHFVVRMNPYTVMKAATRKGHHSVADHIRNTIELGTHNLNALRTDLEPRMVVKLAKQIKQARKIVVVGADLANVLSCLLSYWLVGLGFDSEAPVGSTGILTQKVDLLGHKDLLIAISFGRCLRITVDATIRAHERHVSTFGITDSPRSPIARFCDSCLITPTASSKLSVSYVGPVAAIEALATACAYLSPERTLAVLKRKDKEQRQAHSRWYPPEYPTPAYLRSVKTS